MGSILSQEPSIANLRFVPIRKGRAKKDCEVLKVSPDLTLVKLPDGSFSIISPGRYDSVNGNYAILGYGVDHASAQVLDALVKFGVLTKEAVKAHKETVEIAKKNRRCKDMARSLRHLVSDVGSIADVRKALDDIEEKTNG